jgi:pimeloyl-ACP methyl ester carboxylesterase
MNIIASLLAVAFTAGPVTLPAAQLDVFETSGAVLRDNPLGDPAVRRVAVFAPDGVTRNVVMPLVIYLPGWGGSSEDAIAQGRGGWLGLVVDALAARTPLRLAVVDGRSRYGGSQFLNSTATGRYADYVADEILPALIRRYPPAASGAATLIAGHSSGAYGALLLAMNHPEKFQAVVALSPDSDFDVTHKALVQQSAVRAITRAELDAAMALKKSRLPANGVARLVIGLCANYAPLAGQPGRFEWLYNDRGEWRADTWQRWLDLDPLTLVRKNPKAFASTQRIYLDGAERDEFGANIGARKIEQVLATRAAPVTFYESPDGHSDHLSERLVRGLTWALIGGLPAK